MDFVWPLMLLSLLLVPGLVGAYLWTERRRRRQAERFAAAALLPALATGVPGRRRFLPAALYLVGWTAIAIALARPQLSVPVPVRESTVILAVDVSRSMEVTDLAPSRLVAAKQAAASFLDRTTSGVKVGVVAFSAGAAAVALPTQDRQAVRQAIEGLSSQTATAMGDAIYAALGVPIPGAPARGAPGPVAKPTASATKPPDAIVLLSDGASNRGSPPVEAALAARDLGVKVFTIGIGTREGGDLLIDGRLEHIALDEPALRQVAELTGGQYFYAPTSEDLDRIYQQLGSTLSWEWQKTEVTALFGAFTLAVFALAALLSLLWFNRLP